MSAHEGRTFDVGAALGALIMGGGVAIAADLMTPYGPVVLTLAGICGAFALVAGVLSILPPLAPILRPASGMALAIAIACAVMTGLWYVAPKPAATERGVVASLLPYGETVQALVVRDIPPGGPAPTAPVATTAAIDAPPAPAASTTPIDKKQQALLTALASAEPATRLRGAMTALAERDPAVAAGVIDTLYRSPDPAVRQLAVKRLLAQRRNARLPLLATPANAQAQAFANALQAGGFTVKSINETTGAFDGAVCAATGMTGAVARSGVTINTRCKTGETDGATVLVLQPTDDYKLVGEARNDQGQTAKVELPLM